ncbi:hypothetical protein [Cellulomonas timonensis]|uniref:hypothetical protein n=1 Tax=Cellulomonas timonensis TaxID=1689271 RepID=UPI0009ED68A4|nr:hypothetical protein [Cellulomonas timonensis]
MGRREEYREAVSGLSGDTLDEYLDTRSGLPGPRANLELAGAVADVADVGEAWRLAGSDREYTRLCGVVALGAVAARSDDAARAQALERLRAEASDDRWRVREAVALALQRIGDADPGLLRDVVRDWIAQDDLLVMRAALAGVCEPRLLRDPETAALALEACDRATARLGRLSPAVRRNPQVRVMRQALGYCWSVAGAADPERGLPLFARLAGSSDPDVRWVDRENRRKARLQRLVSPAS